LQEIGTRTVFARTSMDIAELAPSALLETPDAAVDAAGQLIDRYGPTDSDAMLTTHDRSQHPPR
jgi:hypothetical protein